MKNIKDILDKPSHLDNLEPVLQDISNCLAKIASDLCSRASKTDSALNRLQTASNNIKDLALETMKVITVSILETTCIYL